MINFKYGETRLEPGFYILEVSSPTSELDRVIADWDGDTWYQPAIDYDIWQYSNIVYTINVIAKVDIHNLTITELEPLGKYEDQ